MSGVQWVSVEGIIGAGKSTLIKTLKKLNGQDAVIVQEPVQEWIESGILDNAYQNPREWNFPAQCHFFTSRINKFVHSYSTNKCLYVSERSAFSDTLFWDTQLKLNRVDPLIHRVYHDMWSTFQRLQPVPNPTLFVYLRPTLEECMRRMRERARDEEASVDLEYQETLYKLHDETFLEQGVTMPDGTVVPCIIVDGNPNFRDALRVSQSIVKQIEGALL